MVNEYIIEYIYDPLIIEDVLRKYPLIRAKLGTLEEGRKVASFPQYRKNPREIYRILSNQHYPHLVELPLRYQGPKVREDYFKILFG